MADKNLHKLKQDYEDYDNQLTENLLLIKEKDMIIYEKKLDNKNHKERIHFLQEDLKNKRGEYMDKLEKIQLKNKREAEAKNSENSENSKIEKEKEKIDINKLNKVVELHKNSKSYTIVEGVINDFSKLSTEIDKIFGDKEKTSINDEIGFVYVKFEDTAVAFRITDDYYAFCDLLKESSNYFDINPSSHRIYGPDNKIINMTLGVRLYLLQLKEKLGTIPNLVLLPIKSSVLRMNIAPQEEPVLKAAEGYETGELLKNIDNVESELLYKTRKIIFYLIFVCLVFVYNVSNSRVQQSYYINNAFQSRLVEKKYFKSNQYGLENDFKTINNLEDIMDWGIYCLVSLFQYPAKLPNSNQTNVNFTRIMSDFIVVGSLRFIHTRLQDSSTTDTSLKFTYDKFQSAFDDYKNFTLFRPLEYPINFRGKIKSYNIKEAYDVLVPPQIREVYLVFSMFRNLNIFSPKLETFSFEFNAYNYNQDIYTTMKFFIEQSKYGNVEVSSKICNLNFLSVVFNLLSFKLSASVFIDLGFFTMLTAYSLYNVYDIIREIRKLKLKYFLEFWNIIQVVQQSFYICCMAMRISIYFIIYTELKWVPESEYMDTNKICDMYDSMKILEILTICFTMIYFLNYLDKGIVGPIFDTLNKSVKNIVIFLVSYVSTIVGYGMFCNYIFGPYITDLNSIDKSIVRLFLMVFGEYSVVSNMMKIFSNFTLIFLLFFGLTFFILFSNWLTATIIQWYDVDSKEKSLARKATGTILVSIIDEIVIVRKKYIRSVRLFVKRIIAYIKKVKDLKNLMKKKKDVKVEEIVKPEDKPEEIQASKENEENKEEEEEAE